MFFASLGPQIAEIIRFFQLSASKTKAHKAYKAHESTHKPAKGKEPASPQEIHKRPTKAFTGIELSWA